MIDCGLFEWRLMVLPDSFVWFEVLTCQINYSIDTLWYGIIEKIYIAQFSSSELRGTLIESVFSTFRMF